MSKAGNPYLTLIDQFFAPLMPKQARWAYFQLGSTLFCWNTEPFTNEPKAWACWKYRHNKRKGTYRRFGKTLYFAKRKTAKAHALKWYDKAVREKATRYRAIAQAGGE